MLGLGGNLNFYFFPPCLHVVLQAQWAENHLYRLLLTWEIIIFSAVVCVVLVAQCFGGSVILKVGRFHTFKIPFSELKTTYNAWKVFVLKACVEEPLAITHCLVRGSGQISS